MHHKRNIHILICTVHVCLSIRERNAIDKQNDGYDSRKFDGLWQYGSIFVQLIMQSVKRIHLSCALCVAKHLIDLIAEPNFAVLEYQRSSKYRTNKKYTHIHTHTLANPLANRNEAIHGLLGAI